MKRHQFHRDMLTAELTYEQLHDSGRVFHSIGRSKVYIPEFYSNDSQLRTVLVKAVIGYSFRGQRVPENVATDLVNLQRMALERQTRVEDAQRLWNAAIDHVNAVRASGSYLALLAGISYRAWRLGWHDEDIANELRMPRAGVGRILRRLIKYAEELGFKTYEKKHSMPNNNADPEKIVELWDLGKTAPQIAKDLKCSVYAVRHLLRLKGIYKWRHRKCGHTLPLKRERTPDYRGIRRFFCPECRRAYMTDYFRRRREEKFIKTVAWG